MAGAKWNAFLVAAVLSNCGWLSNAAGAQDGITYLPQGMGRRHCSDGDGPGRGADSMTYVASGHPSWTLRGMAVATGNTQASTWAAPSFLEDTTCNCQANSFTELTVLTELRPASASGLRLRLFFRKFRRRCAEGI